MESASKGSCRAVRREGQCPTGGRGWRPAIAPGSVGKNGERPRHERHETQGHGKTFLGSPPGGLAQAKSSVVFRAAKSPGRLACWMSCRAVSPSERGYVDVRTEVLMAPSGICRGRSHQLEG
jgi:hypothetical protein